MRYLARFNLAWLNLDRTIANSAPVRNTEHIQWIEQRISEWQLILLQCERRLV